MTLTEEQIAEIQTGRPLRLKVLEVNTSFDGQDGIDYLIVDEAADTAKILTGGDGIYCQVADRQTADIFVKAVNEYPGTLSALEAQAAELAEVRQQCVDANEARIDAEAQLAEARMALGLMLREHDILSGNFGDVMNPKHRRPDRWPTAAEAARRAYEGDHNG